MKLPLVVIAAALAAFPGAGLAQAPAAKQQPKQAPAHTGPKPVATVPIRPGVQAPVDTAKAMEQAERLAIQSDLAWVGGRHY